MYVDHTNTCQNIRKSYQGRMQRKKLQINDKWNM